MDNKPLLIFDFDGTIVNSLQIGLELTNKLSDKYRYPKINSIEQIRDKSGVNFIKNHIKWFYIPFWFKAMNKLIMSHLDNIKVYPHIENMLSQLSTNYTIGILGGGPNEYHKKLVQKLNINYFDFIYSNKPYNKHYIIKKILKKYKHSYAVMIGDDINDIKSAQKLGIYTIAVTWGGTKKHLFEQIKPDYIVEDQANLYSVIESIN